MEGRVPPMATGIVVSAVYRTECILGEFRDLSHVAGSTPGTGSPEGSSTLQAPVEPRPDR